MKARRITLDIIVYIILIVLSVIWVLPILWIILQSFTGTRTPTVASRAELIPSVFSFEQYVNLFTNQVYNTSGTLVDSNYNFFFMTVNGTLRMGAFPATLLLALICMVFSTLLTLMSAYGLSRLRFKGRQGMMRINLVIGMFPGFISLIIMYWLMQAIGLLGNIWALAIIYCAGAGMGYYISKGFFDTISKQIDEAAMVDGATRFQIFYKIILPLSKPIVVYTALTAFMAPWGEYITSSYLLGGYLPTKDNWTVAILLRNFIYGGDDSRNQNTYWGQFCAGAVIISIPVVIVFLSMQKYYISGVTGGAVKG